MVRSRGKDFEEAVKELQKTFSVPKAPAPSQNRSKYPTNGEEQSSNDVDSTPKPPSGRSKSKSFQKNKVLKVLNSMKRKKNLNASF